MESNDPIRELTALSFSDHRLSPVFKLYAITVGLSMIGDSLTLVALPFVILDAGRPATTLGYALGAQAAATFIVTVPAGMLADRFPRAVILASGMFACAVTTTAIFVLALTGSLHTLPLIALEAAYGAGRACYLTTFTSLIPSLVHRDLLRQANAAVGGLLAAAGIAGPALAGALAALAGPAWALGCDALTFAVAGLVIAHIARRVPTRSGSVSDPDPASGRAPFRYILQNRWLATSLAFFIAFPVLVAAPIFVLGPITVASRIGGPAAWGGLLVVSGIGSAVGAAAAYRSHTDRPLRACFLAAAGPSLALILLGLGVTSLVALGCAFFVYGLGLAFGDALWDASLQAGVPGEILGRITSYDWAATGAVRPIAFAVVLPVAHVLGQQATLSAAGTVLVVASIAVAASRPIRTWTLTPRTVTTGSAPPAGSQDPAC